MQWDCLAHAFLYYGSTKDVSNSIGTIHNSNFTHHFTNLLYMMCMCQKSSETWFARLLWWQFFGHSYWFSRRTFQSHAAAGALSLSEAAIVNLLSSQRTLRKRDRWSGLVVMVMWVNFCVCVREGWVMVMSDGWCAIFAQYIEICNVSIRVLNNHILW